jgi:hypothetical protein
MMTGWLRLLAIISLAAILVLSLLSGDLKVRTFIPGPIAHVIAYAGAAGLLAQLYNDAPARRRIVLGLAAAAFGLELVQWPIPGRDSSILDFLISTAGACLGVGAIRLRERLTAGVPQE